MPTDEQLDAISRAARTYAAGRARDGVEVSSREVYDRLVADALELERQQSGRSSG